MINAHEKLASAIASKRISHALFFSCPDAVLSLEAARNAAALIVTDDGDVGGLYNCPNYIELDCAKFPKKEVRKYVREFFDELIKRPFLDRERVVLLYNAHTLNQLVENMFLKVLEEPSGDTIFILTGNEHAMLSTIRSRCSTVRIPMLGAEAAAAYLEAHGASAADARCFCEYTNGSCDMADKLIKSEDERKLRSDTLDIFHSLLMGALPLDAANKLVKSCDARDAIMFMLIYARDILLVKIGRRDISTRDRADKIEKIAPRFTIGRINCIIELLCSALSRLSSIANSGVNAPVIEKLFIEISEER